MQCYFSGVLMVVEYGTKRVQTSREGSQEVRSGSGGAEAGACCRMGCTSVGQSCSVGKGRSKC